MQIEITQTFGDGSVTLGCDTEHPELTVLTVANLSDKGDKTEAGIVIPALEAWKLKILIRWSAQTSSFRERSSGPAPPLRRSLVLDIFLHNFQWGTPTTDGAITG